MAFVKKHLSNPFTLEETKVVHAGVRIFREIFSNILAHRDYSTGEVAKFVIERDRMFTENGNRPHGWGMLDPAQFRPYSKNPPIAKVFREVALADELGSGMRNTYKYTRLYSGAEPQFVEGEVFRTVIPLASVATVKAGPKASDQVGDQVSDQVSDQDESPIIFASILDFCATPRSKKEICEALGYKNLTYFTRKYLAPLLTSGKLKMTIPDKQKSKNQKYIKA